jgi:hypothetical protein
MKLGLRNHEGRAMELATGKHFAKSNPGMFQERLLALFNKKIQSLGQEMSVD